MTERGSINAFSGNFAGSAPGQSLADVIERISIDELSQFIGDDVVALVKAMPGIFNVDAALRDIAIRLAQGRAEELLSNNNTRKIIVHEMSHAKLAELKSRIGVDSDTDILKYDPTREVSIWKRYLNFFGVEYRAVSSAIAQADSSEISPKYRLFPHQRKAADKVFAAIKDGRGRLVLHMPTGAGKTRTAMHVICRVLNKTEPAVIVWLANSSELLDQAADAFGEAWECLGNRKVDLYRFWGDHSPDIKKLSDGLIIAGFQKFHAYKSKNNLDFLRLGQQVRLVVVDEAHQATAPTYKATIEALTGTGKHDALLGLTATPGRTWSDISADEELSEFFNEKKVILEIDGWDNPVQYLMDEGYLARPRFNQLVYEDGRGDSRAIVHNQSGDDYSVDVLDRLSMNLDRNLAIIAEAERLIESGHNRIILFSSSVRHGEVIAAALSAKGIDARIVTGETPRNLRARVIKAFRGESSTPMVLCNYGVLTTGFDAPNTSAAIIARPTKSLVLFSQMVGRATRGRKAGGNETCEITTVVDVSLPGFGDVAEAFVNWEDVWGD